MFPILMPGRQSLKSHSSCAEILQLYLELKAAKAMLENEKFSAVLEGLFFYFSLLQLVVSLEVNMKRISV